jgi:hypothetical protein
MNKSLLCHQCASEQTLPSSLAPSLSQALADGPGKPVALAGQTIRRSILLQVQLSLTRSLRLPPLAVLVKFHAHLGLVANTEPGLCSEGLEPAAGLPGYGTVPLTMPTRAGADSDSAEARRMYFELLDVPVPVPLNCCCQCQCFKLNLHVRLQT